MRSSLAATLATACTFSEPLSSCHFFTSDEKSTSQLFGSLGVVSLTSIATFLSEADAVVDSLLMV